MDIVKKHVYKTRGYTPEQLLQKQKLDLEKEKLNYDLLTKLLDKPDYKDIVKDKIDSINFNINFKQEVDVEICKKEIQKDETITPYYEVDKVIKGRKPKGRKIQKIDPNNLERIVAIYDSMAYLLRAPENKDCHKSSIQKAIKYNTVYKNYRWNFVGKDEDCNTSNIKPTLDYKSRPSVNEPILVLNRDKTFILESFYTRDYLQKYLNISKIKIKRIVENEEVYDDKYFVKYSKCPKELLEKYDKPINRIKRPHAVPIKQINPISKEVVIYNTLGEAERILGIWSGSIKNAITNGNLLCGSLWEYVV